MSAAISSIQLPEIGQPEPASQIRIPLVDLHQQHQPLLYNLEQAIREVLLQGDFVLGQAVEAFETTFAYACGSRYGVGVGSGGDAITLGLRACGIGPGDDVLVPANTFVGTVLAILATGAQPLLVDCDPETALIDLMAAEKAITPQTRAIVPVHLYGQMVEPKRLLDLASTYDLMIFEDAAHAPLAERDGYRAGSLGVAAAFSFYPSKNLGGFGDGGIVVTEDGAIADRVRVLRNYGASRKNHHVEPGINSRLDTLQAAILQVKLPHLPCWNGDRNDIAQRYDARLRSLQPYGILPMSNQSGQGHVYHLYTIRITPNCPLSRTVLQTEMASRGIETGIHYPTPCHLIPALQELGYTLGDFPIAECLSDSVLSLPMYPGLTDLHIDTVVGTLETLLNQSSQRTAKPLLPLL